MKIVIAPDSFKGSMSSMAIIKTIREVAENCIDSVQITEVPIADGGEGTIEAIIHANNGRIEKRYVTNPLGETIEAVYGIVEDTAIIEMAVCSGVTLIKSGHRSPLNTTSYGTGEMIKHVLDDGFRKIIIGIGGSATNDGGMGAMQALGVRYFTKDHEEIDYMCGKELIHISRIDLSELDPRISDCDISVMCDVTNPLTGPLGATYVYGGQKGGNQEDLAFLESGMLHYEKLINTLGKSSSSMPISKTPGAGAAGGMGAALMVYLSAKLVSGIEAILEVAEFGKKIEDADMIITGEGRVDGQSASGKVVHGVTEYANKYNIPVIVIAGGVGNGYEAVYDIGVKAIMTLPNQPMDLEYCMDNTKQLLEEAAYNVFRLIKVGMHIK
jgi:glycerate kinase